MVRAFFVGGGDQKNDWTALVSCCVSEWPIADFGSHKNTFLEFWINCLEGEKYKKRQMWLYKMSKDSYAIQTGLSI